MFTRAPVMPLVPLVRTVAFMLAWSLLALACAGRGPADGDDGVIGEGEGEGEGDATPCTVDADCVAVGDICINAGCMRVEGTAPVVAQPAARTVDIEGVALVDTNPDPAIFEASLVAAERDVEIVAGTTTQAWVYLDANGDDVARIPGPRIEVDAGTRVIIHFENTLPVTTNIHWHGVNVAPNMDGADINGSITAPGATFDFDFEADDARAAWFHPQLDADEQVERGLYGAFIVRDPANEPDVDVERVLVLDDVLLDDNAQVVARDDGDARATERALRFASVLGRQGNHVLVNGVENPVLDVTPGTVERWRIVNAANARMFVVHGATEGVSFVQIGTDGGFVPAPRQLSALVIGAGERVDVLVTFAADAVGTDVALVTTHEDRGYGMTDPGPLTLATLRHTADAQDPATPVPSVSVPINALASLERADKQIVIDAPTLDADGRVRFSLNGQGYPAVTPLVSTYGYIETWEVVNTTSAVQPFHLYGMPFQVLSIDTDGEERAVETFLSWKDTVTVPPHSTLRFVVRYSLHQGLYFFESAILEHAERGMIGVIDLRSMMG